MPWPLTASVVLFLAICYLKNPLGYNLKVCMKIRVCQCGHVTGAGGRLARLPWAVRSQAICRNQIQQANKQSSSGNPTGVIILSTGYRLIKSQRTGDIFKATGFSPQHRKAKPSANAGQKSLCLLTVACGDHLEGSDAVETRPEDLDFQQVLK